jgi:hypothetical protein
VSATLCLHSVSGAPNLPAHPVGSRPECCGGCAERVLLDSIAPESERDRIVWRAMLVAKDLAACEALLRGESVPRERIDWQQAKRLGRAA